MSNATETVGPTKTTDNARSCRFVPSSSNHDSGERTASPSVSRGEGRLTRSCVCDVSTPQRSAVGGPHLPAAGRRPRFSRLAMRSRRLRPTSASRTSSTRSKGEREQENNGEDIRPDRNAWVAGIAPGPRLLCPVGQPGFAMESNASRDCSQPWRATRNRAPDTQLRDHARGDL
jgi:hypothetical protein